MARVKPTHLAIGALGVLIIAGTFLIVLPEVASYGSVIDQFRRFTATDIAVLIALAVLNVITFAPPLQAALPGLGFWRALSSSQISAAFAHAVPAGDALGAGAQVALYRRWGFGAHAIAVALALVGAFNGLFFVVLPPLGLVLLQFDGTRRTGLLLIAIAALAALIAITVGVVAAIRSDASAQRVGAFAARASSPVLRVLRRGPAGDWGEHLVGFRHEAIDVLRRRWPGLLFGTAASNLAVFACVVVALRLCGAGADQLSWQEILVAWSLTRLLLLIPITPGGIGVVELGMTGLLVAFGGDNAAVVAGVLLERALTFLPPIILGAAFGLQLGVSRRGAVRDAPAD
jgi:uncharacterized membrane protein YbhN (UPF0104 family)